MTIKFALNKNEVDSNKKLAKALADKFKVQSAIAEEKKRTSASRSMGSSLKPNMWKADAMWKSLSLSG